MLSAIVIDRYRRGVGVRLPKLCAAVASLAGIDREIPRGDELYDYVP